MVINLSFRLNDSDVNESYHDLLQNVTSLLDATGDLTRNAG